MSKHFQQLTLADRKIIEWQLSTGHSKTDIAACLDLSLSGLYRELARLSPDLPYDAEEAQRDYERKREQRKFPSSLNRYPGLAEYIADQILHHGRTPTAIARTINAGKTPFPPNSISVSTIYNHIRAGAIPGVDAEFAATGSK